jgi:hypothetical protein
VAGFNLSDYNDEFVSDISSTEALNLALAQARDNDPVDDTRLSEHVRLAAALATHQEAERVSAAAAAAVALRQPAPTTTPSSATAAPSPPLTNGSPSLTNSAINSPSRMVRPPLSAINPCAEGYASFLSGVMTQAEAEVEERLPAPTTATPSGATAGLSSPLSGAIGSSSIMVWPVSYANLNSNPNPVVEYQ